MSINVYSADAKALQNQKGGVNTSNAALKGSSQNFDSFMSVMSVDYQMQRSDNDEKSQDVAPKDVFTEPQEVTKPVEKHQESAARNEVEQSNVADTSPEKTAVNQDDNMDSDMVIDELGEVVNGNQEVESETAIEPVESNLRLDVPLDVNVAIQDPSLVVDPVVSKDVNPITPIVEVNDSFVIEFSAPIVIDVDNLQQATTVAVEKITEFVEAPIEPTVSESIFDSEALPEIQEKNVSTNVQQVSQAVPVIDGDELLIQFGDEEVQQKPLLQRIQQQSQSATTSQTNFNEPTPEIISTAVKEELIQQELKLNRQVRDSNEQELIDLEDEEVDFLLPEGDKTPSTSTFTASTTTAIESVNSTGSLKSDFVQTVLNTNEQIQNLKDDTTKLIKNQITKPSFAQMLAHAKQEAELFEPNFNTKLLKRLELRVRDPSGTIQLDIAQEESSIHVKVIAPVEALDDMRLVGQDLSSSLEEKGLELGSYEMSTEGETNGEDSTSVEQDESTETNPAGTPTGTGNLINQRV